LNGIDCRLSSSAVWSRVCATTCIASWPRRRTPLCMQW
jgi:hypothetical protein